MNLPFSASAHVRTVDKKGLPYASKHCCHCLQQGEEDAHWACSMLFKGATCQLPDDWKLEQRRLQRQMLAKQQVQALQLKQQACCCTHCFKHAIHTMLANVVLEPTVRVLCDCEVTMHSIADQAKDALLAGRAWRAKQRSMGVSAVHRYAEAQDPVMLELQVRLCACCSIFSVSFN